MSWDWLTRSPSNSAYIMENKMNLSKPMRIKLMETLYDIRPGSGEYRLVKSLTKSSSIPKLTENIYCKSVNNPHRLIKKPMN